MANLYSCGPRPVIYTPLSSLISQVIYTEVGGSVFAGCVIGRNTGLWLTVVYTTLSLPMMVMVMVMGINIGKKEDAHNNDSGQMPSNWCMHSLLRIRIIIIIVEMHLDGDDDDGGDGGGDDDRDDDDDVGGGD